MKAWFAPLDENDKSGNLALKYGLLVILLSLFVPSSAAGGLSATLNPTHHNVELQAPKEFSNVWSNLPQ